MNYKEDDNIDIDIDVHNHNLMYYNQIVEKKLKNESPKKTDKKVSASFSSQKVDFSDYLVAPDGYEAVVYPLYF